MLGSYINGKKSLQQPTVVIPVAWHNFLFQAAMVIDTTKNGKVGGEICSVILQMACYTKMTQYDDSDDDDDLCSVAVHIMIWISTGIIHLWIYHLNIQRTWQRQLNGETEMCFGNDQI